MTAPDHYDRAARLFLRLADLDHVAQADGLDEETDEAVREAARALLRGHATGGILDTPSPVPRDPRRNPA
ncbi:MAG: hypothetical protein AAF791_11930 [Bacteroidota bacterium]